MPVKNVCHCDNPPGGGGECEHDQLSICRNDGSDCRHECRTRPARVSTEAELKSWAFEVITGKASRGPGGLTASEQALIRSGRYVSPDGTVHTFELPEMPQGMSYP